MNLTATSLPRWGNEGRDRKAAAILRTLTLHCGKEIKTGTWIDVGCGSGGIAAALARDVTRMIGIDPEPWPSWQDAMVSNPNLTFVTANFDNSELPVPECSADVVICNQVYEHVLQPQTLLKNIHRVLKPGGRCYFAGPNLLWPVEPHVFWPFVHWLPRSTARSLMRGLCSKQADALDAYSKSYWTLRKWFREVGLDCENGMGARLVTELRMRCLDGTAAVARHMPEALVNLLTPYSPGFVFILRKT